MSTIRVGRHDYPEDIFASTKMSFGDHIEELRTHMIRAGIGLVICLLLGFAVDGIGYTLKKQGVLDYEIGIGRPMMFEIQSNVTDPMNDFYKDRLEGYEDRLRSDRESGKEAEDIRPIKVKISTEGLKQYFQTEAGKELPKTIDADIEVAESDLYAAQRKAQIEAGYASQLTSLSVQEPMIVYFKVSLLCGAIIASPYLFWQIWSFVGVGLYPHERKYIKIYLPFSLTLFLGGVFMCQFLVMPIAVSAMLSFNEWLDVEPDIRLSEWLNFAILLPLVFGLSFQTPLFMLFFERIGIFTIEDYVYRWRIALFIMAASAALITPPDIVSMVCLCGPMFALYIFGIWLCKIVPRPYDEFDTESAEDVAV